MQSIVYRFLLPASCVLASSAFSRLDAQSCPTSIKDSSVPANCISASSTPMLGTLYPLSEKLFVTPDGRVGLGTLDPAFHRFRVVGQANQIGIVDLTPSGAVARAWTFNADGGQLRFCDESTGAGNRLVLNGDGHVGIGTDHPEYNQLRVSSQSNQIGLEDKDASGAVSHEWGLNADNGQFRIADETSGGNRLVIASNGNVGIGVESPQSRLHVAGTVTVGVLKVNGADLAESMQSVGAACEPGSVVVLDSRTAGRVRLSRGSYDHSVIGVVSGAGGVNPGLRLGQDGVLDGDVAVAACGRVYVRCSTENGPIAPGDLLTTGTKPGHAMKATDPQHSLGAVIGKAMEVLSDGEGLVLVRITLG